MIGALIFIAGAVTGIVALLGWQYYFYRKFQRAQDAFLDGVPQDPSCIDPTD